MSVDSNVRMLTCEQQDYWLNFVILRVQCILIELRRREVKAFRAPQFCEGKPI